MQNLDMNYKKRRDALVELVRAEHHAFSGPIILFAPCDDPNRSFVQDSSFYYFSGIVEPASVITLADAQQTFYRPNYTDLRDKWVASPAKITQEYVQAAGFDGLQVTGQEFNSIHVYPYFDFVTYSYIIALISDALKRDEKIFTLYPNNSYEFFMIRLVVDRLALVIPHLKENIIDISSQVAQLRRKKDMSEIEILY